MQEWAYRGHLTWLLYAFLLAVIGCTAQVEPTSTLPPTVSSFQSPAIVTRDGNLTALRTTVWRIRDGEQMEIEQHRDLEITEGDQITLDGQAHGLLRFQDDVVVELFRNTDIELLDARQDEDGILVFRLRQTSGSAHLELNAERDARIELQTELATSTVSTAGGEEAEFVLCHKPPPGAMTCLVTIKGAIDVAAGDGSVTVPAGEAVSILEGMPLGDPICVVQEELGAWLERERNGEQNSELNALMSEWPPFGCDAMPTATATPQPLLPSTQNMVPIEGGMYEVGSRGADDFHIAAHVVEVPAYWIDIYEVTNEAYAAFLSATGNPPPAAWPYPAGRENHPVQGVTWDDANAYCQWSLKRLPTEAEWEIAGRGAGDPPPLYPWGDDPFAGGQVDSLPYDQTYAVGSVPFAASPSGVYDLVGNVWEWVGEAYAPLEEGARMLRGGRHGFPRDLAYRQPAAPAEPSLLPFAGFRCAADQVEGG